ncbi:calcium-binding protein [Flavisphingomonas formosensis]|uniref:calcium-binding protein n=1 Tax=Flavisphingomonas formosensis TaxID=861534 RepID=UPI0012F90F0E|nr:calcium-binding protein [Sphingomonas formosensis]
MTNITGTPGSDTLTGTVADDVVNGLEGGDTLSGLTGNDLVIGGPGMDRLIVNYGAAATDIVMTAPTPSGPIFVTGSPGGASLSSVGAAVASQGSVETYSGFDLGQYQKLWWGPSAGAALDGQIDSPSETMTLASISGNVAVWTGQTTVASDGGPRTVYTQLVITIEQGADGWVTSASAGISGGPQAVAQINGSTFAVKEQLLASFDLNGPYFPFNLFYDGSSGNTPARSSVTGQLIYDDGGLDGVVHGGALGSTEFHGVENLSITSGAGNDTLFGGGGVDMLNGGSGNDIVNGGAGNDKLYGSFGVDTVSYADAAGGITLNLISTTYQNTGGSGIDLVNSIENVVGSAFDDVLTGNQFSNIFTGGAGDDRLEGGLGNDFLYGGDGMDVASYAAAGGAVRVSLAITTAQSTISAGTDTLAGIENLIGGAYDDQLTGDEGNNMLTGNAGNDSLKGGLGDDVLNGGAGVDTASYAGTSSGVTIDLSLTAAQDTHGAGVDTLLFVENVTGSDYDDVLTGSAQVNVMLGGKGNDIIDAGSSSDTVDGGYGNDILKGAAGDDILVGGVGSDTLIGGGGADTLTGGTQGDRFVYASAGESTVDAADRITDFAKGDSLDLSAIDADTTVAGDQAFHLAPAFTSTAGEYMLSYDAGTNTTTALFDTNGDANADMAILFTGDVTALTGSWVL